MSHSTAFAYDSYGNRTAVTNALSKVWTFAYDGKGRVTSVTDPLGHVTSYTYNNANLVLTVTDALTHVTTSRAEARLLSARDPGEELEAALFDRILHDLLDHRIAAAEVDLDVVGVVGDAR